ncbi:MAG TPA: carboxylating nicotinate-nucleotide diphosphorylase [Bacteroidales bacterium]|nr:MAG: nicotinate-nucleotide diphosphorylase (carboxylating) [Bacteroidetes bacterium GWE2_42_24]OFY27508.1 MAG: nicotinate-nucleotide diphosphorylase (carboxylating) [Bacteroidetes bacterium GWF2_43_11]PKP15905.1 MAG: nicotinate-nucleotide diphosphorylase (carboxylating) [Bacteroidetes bacterium HGW-Bacteroidetes-22]HAQ65689.1 carboxylating nicotinate-nucleotide diphosphorylase [Bacteroidales bacterium]HBZ66029.1 carboxylating nicotinate-nucleotide diphosphorylase [Bacteroidales bacterium]
MTIDEIIALTLVEDMGDGDHTSLSTIPATARGKVRLLVKEAGILAGVDVARKVFLAVDNTIIFTQMLSDGTPVKPGDVAFTVEGPSVSLLGAERTALNFMQRMSGIATATNRLVKLLNGLNTRLLDTRKTTPLMRQFEKMAVKTGGGNNHRFGLYDMILIKDNHVDFAGGIGQAIEAANSYLKKCKKSLQIEIEVRNFSELNEVLVTGRINRIMLDNFSPADLKKAVEMIGGRYETEASGGITEDTLRSYAESGVNYISVGALTHHIRSLDLSLKAC